VVKAAIDAYHGLLSDAQGAETQSQLDDQQRRRGLFFGDRPLCTVLRPRFLSPEQYGFLIARVRPLLQAFYEAHSERLGARLGASDSHFGGYDLCQAVTEFDGSTADDFRQAVLMRRTRPRLERPSTVPVGLALRQQWRSLVMLPLRRATRQLI